jgi:hypothetical protein
MPLPRPLSHALAAGPALPPGPALVGSQTLVGSGALRKATRAAIDRLAGPSAACGGAPRFDVLRRR